MTIANGTSEIDTVVLRLVDYQVEIKNWESYSLSQRFLVPTAGWQFVVGDEDPTLLDALVPGAKVELAVNGRIQCTGYLDHKSIDSSADGGTRITVMGRDVLGPVVDATVDPLFKFIQGLTIVDVLLATLKPFNIGTIYNADLYNIYAVSGYEKGSSGSRREIAVQVQDIAQQADGTLAFKYITSNESYVQFPQRKDLKTLQLEQAKPHAGEGVHAYLDRLLRRLGLTLWAMADGSGVVIDTADFSSEPNQKIVRRRDEGSTNNVLRGSVSIDLTSQPSCIVATGFGGGRDTQKSKLRVIMVNELVGVLSDGSLLPEILAIKARYPSAKVLPLRPALVPLDRPVGDERIAKPFFLKDDESKNLFQLEAFTRREMATRQQKALQVQYELVGHTFDGHPWAVNTLVAVDDDALGIHEDLWVLERTFTKSVTSGTKTSLRLIRPYTLQIAQ